MNNYDEILEEAGALKADIHRMRDTDDVNEFFIVSTFAKDRLERIHEYNYASLNRIK